MEVDRRKLPPGPKRWPIIGNLLQLGRLPHRDFARFCSTYGPLVYLRLGVVDAITTDDPEVIREILVGQDDVFASRPSTVAAARLAYDSADVALAPMGPHWKHMRRICMEHLLTTRRLESFATHRAEEARHLLRDVWAKSRSGETINLRQALGAFSMNNVTKMLLGKQYFGPTSAGQREATEFMAIIHELFHLLGIIYLGDYLPAWRWLDPTGCERKMRGVEKKVNQFHQKILEEHRERTRTRKEIRRGNCKAEEADDDMDFVDVLLSLPGEDGEEHLDDKEIKALMQGLLFQRTPHAPIITTSSSLFSCENSGACEVESAESRASLDIIGDLAGELVAKDMIAAATDTSAVTSEWALTELLRHPHVLKKAQFELDSVIGRHRPVLESDLPRLAYLRCIVRETFRLHPAGPFLIPHESLRPAHLMNGRYTLPSHTRVFINTHALGRNPHVWGHDVDEFRPERHEKGKGKVEISHGDDFVILPFGAGRRRCPGAPLGVVMVLMGLGTLLHGFEWKPADGKKPEEVGIEEVYGLTMPRAEPLRAVATARLKEDMYLAGK